MKRRKSVRIDWCTVLMGGKKDNKQIIKMPLEKKNPKNKKRGERGCPNSTPPHGIE